MAEGLYIQATVKWLLLEVSMMTGVLNIYVLVKVHSFQVKKLILPILMPKEGHWKGFGIS